VSCYQPWTLAWHVLVEANPLCSNQLDTTEFTFALTPLTYLKYFALTCLIEAPFVWLAFGRKRAVAITLLLNLSTHPLICFYLVNQAQGRTFGEFTLAAEGFAFSIEMLIASILTRSLKAPAWILAANFVSWTIGSYLS
jgi:hypothetical protein